MTLLRRTPRPPMDAHTANHVLGAWFSIIGAIIVVNHATSPAP
jgi:hypothetical protein